MAKPLVDEEDVGALASRHVDVLSSAYDLHFEGASRFDDFDVERKERKDIWKSFVEIQSSSKLSAADNRILKGLKRINEWIENGELTPHWRPIDSRSLKPYMPFFSTARIIDVAAARRSFKTVIATRRLVFEGLLRGKPNVFFPAFATTYSQGRKIFWDNLKRYVPKDLVKQIRESDLEIHLKNGGVLLVVGMDKPTRIEGVDIGYFVFDETADQKPEGYTQTIRPCLINTKGGGMRIGKPRGRNHWFRWFMDSRDCNDPNRAAFHWTGYEVLDVEELNQMAAEVDELTMRQEVGAEFVSFEGLAYYNFSREFHLDASIEYRPDLDLCICFDFNTAPGVAQVVQHWPHDGITRSIGEVHIPRDSTTPRVARKIVEDWGHHQGIVKIYGDATGGARSTKSEKTDWILVEEILREPFGTRLLNRVPRANPAERSRVNAVNCRLLNTVGDRHWLINPNRCPNLVRDLEGVTVVEGGSGELDKKADKALTHHTDAVGYFFVYEFPVEGKSKIVHAESWT